MNWKYTLGAVIVGVLFIGGAWVFQDEDTTPKQATSSQIYEQPAAQAQKSAAGDANF